MPIKKKKFEKMINDVKVEIRALKAKLKIEMRLLNALSDSDIIDDYIEDRRKEVNTRIKAIESELKFAGSWADTLADETKPLDNKPESHLKLLSNLMATEEYITEYIDRVQAMTGTSCINLTEALEISYDAIQKFTKDEQFTDNAEYNLLHFTISNKIKDIG